MNRWRFHAQHAAAVVIAALVVAGCEADTRLEETPDQAVYQAAFTHAAATFELRRPVLVHPGTIPVNVESGLIAPWDRAELYEPAPSDAVTAAASATEGFAVCTPRANVFCEGVGEREDVVVVTRIEWSEPERPRLWLTLIEIHPDAVSSRTFEMTARAVGETWAIAQWRLAASEH